MTTPTPISQHRPQNNDEDREAFTSKNDLAGQPLIITSAKSAKGKLGVFWIVEAAYVSSGERVVFTGSKVIDQLMSAVKEANAFPVAAVVVKVDADNPQGYYWDLVDPPESSVPDAAPTGNGSAPTSRVDQVAARVKESENLTVEDVVALCAEIGGEGAKVNDLSDDQYAVLLERLSEWSVPF